MLKNQLAKIETYKKIIFFFSEFFSVFYVEITSEKLNWRIISDLEGMICLQNQKFN
jgi:hypothetical protein